MEPISPIPLSRLEKTNATPESVPGNSPEAFAQVMARRGTFARPKENPMGLNRDGAAPKTPRTLEEKAGQKSRETANDPEVTAFIADPISTVAYPSPPNQPGEPPPDLEEPTFFGKPEAPTQNPTLAATEEIVSGSLIPPVANDFLIAGETGPASAPAQGTWKENRVVSKAFENSILYPAPDSLANTQKVSPETTEIVMRSFQTTTDNGPSFSPQGPAIPKTTPIVDGPDPSPALILGELTLKSRNNETTSLEPKLDSPAAPLAAFAKTEKVAATPILGELPITEAGPIESNSQSLRISSMAASPATSKEVLSDRRSSPAPAAERLPDPEKTSTTLTGRDMETSLLPRASTKKVEPGIALQYPGEGPADSGGPEMHNPVGFQEDTPLGVMAKGSDQPRVEGGPPDHLVEGPAKGSPEWVKEALSVYQQFNKGALRALQQNGDRIQMTLDPPELGSLLLEINRDRNFVTAHLWTDNPHTKELLDFSQGQLQKTLELNGFKLDRFEVLVQPDLKSFQEQRWFGERQPDRDPGGAGRRRDQAEASIRTPPETTPGRFSQGNRYVDTWV